MTRVLTITLMVLAACTSPAPPSMGPATCRGVIERLAGPPADHEVVLDVVALPTDWLLPANPTQAPNELFAKHGLVVLGSAEVLLTPDAVDARVEWSGVAVEGRSARHRPCPDATGWVVYPGGYLVPAPTCLPVIVRSGDRTQTVHIAVGTACP